MDRLIGTDLDPLLVWLWSFNEFRDPAAMLVLAAESAFGRDWLSPEEDAAWANL